MTSATFSGPDVWIEINISDVDRIEYFKPKELQNALLDEIYRRSKELNEKEEETKKGKFKE